jgi:hypothetical protein
MEASSRHVKGYLRALFKVEGFKQEVWYEDMPTTIWAVRFDVEDDSLALLTEVSFGREEFVNDG